MQDSSDAAIVGRVVGLWRYPVKSMGGETLAEAEVSWAGLAGDRRWAFIRHDAVGSGFPWFTLRQRADMSRFSPSFEDPGRPDRSRTVVRTPSGRVLEVTDPALGTDLCPGGAAVIKQDRGVFDTFPLSLITTQTIARLGETVAERLKARRFRPNFLIEAKGDTPFAEDAWVGRVLCVGGLRLRVDQRDRRCVVITIDPETGERSPDVLRAVTAQRQGCLGVYGSTVAPGRVAVGDPVSLAP